MKYITTEEFNRDGIEGYFNIPLNTIIERKKDGYMYYDNRKICVATSYAAHRYFSLDDDEAGILRNKLCQSIIKKLDGHGGEKWNIIYKDNIAKKYKKEEHEDYWLWNDKFYNAPINDLKHIASTIGIEVERLIW